MPNYFGDILTAAASYNYCFLQYFVTDPIYSQYNAVLYGLPNSTQHILDKSLQKRNVTKSIEALYKV
jgi:hypothetical protein